MFRCGKIVGVQVVLPSLAGCASMVVGNDWPGLKLAAASCDVLEEGCAPKA